MNMRFDSCWDGAGTFWVCNKVSRRVYQRTNHKYRHVSAPCFETAMIERNKHKIIIGYHRSYILNCNARIQWTCCCNAFDEYKASLACGGVPHCFPQFGPGPMQQICKKSGLVRH
ncbi:unnamed protein product [Malus baccata var. baccata]